MKIAIVVHGRFHAFDLARALLARGNDVHVFTNYPAWAAKRFGLDEKRVHSCWHHGVATRIVEKMGRRAMEVATPAVHTTFGKWASERLQDQKWDVVHTFTGTAEEVLREVKCGQHLLVRGSAHIRTQRQILDDETARTGVKLERPGEWMVAREEREYQLCDRLLVLSTFALNSFLEKGVPSSKLALLPLGVDLQAFRSAEEVLDNRRRRILAGEPLSVLFTGTLNFRKGLYDIDRIVRGVDPRRFRFRLVGPVPPESKEFVARFPDHVEFVPRQPQARLPQYYAGGDLFLFPTIEDGFAVVLTQAYAGALPILTTPNCAGPDIVRHGKTGWILPIRQPEAFIEQLRWCDENREVVAGMVQKIHDDFHARSWDQVAADFETIAHGAMELQHG